MTLDTRHSVNASFLSRRISIQKMQQLLASDMVKATDELVPNQCGNLAIWRDSKCVGYIDIAQETVEISPWAR